MRNLLFGYTRSRTARFVGCLAVAGGTIGMLTGSAARAQDGKGKPSAIEVRIDAITLETGVVVYNTQIINRSAAALGDVTLEVGVPRGAQLERTWTPASATLQAKPNRLVWRLKTLPASSILGPFAYAASVSGARPAAGGRRIRAVARWRLPRHGSAAGLTSRLEDEATETQVTRVLAAGPLAPLPGTGIQYFVPTGDRGEVVIERSTVEPPAVSGRTWVATYRVTKEHPGSLVLVVPLRRPAPAHSQLRVAAGSGDGVWHAQPLLGTVTPDGLHGAFAADGNTLYALSAGSTRLSAGLADIDRFLGETLAGAAFDALVDADSILAKGEALQDLITSLTSEGVIIIDQGTVWVAIDTDATGGGDGGGSSADDAVLHDCTSTACFWYDPTVPFCGGEGGSVAVYGGGGFNVECDSGETLTCDRDGTCIGSSCAETGDADGDGHCACAEGEDTATCDDDDNNPDVHFAPVPGCQELLCFVDPTTLASLPVSTLEDAALGGDLAGLSPTLAGVLEDLLTNYTHASPLDRPTVAQLTAPLAAGSVQGAIGVVGRHVAMLLRGELVPSLSPPP